MEGRASDQEEAEEAVVEEAFLGRRLEGTAENPIHNHQAVLPGVQDSYLA